MNVIKEAAKTPVFGLFLLMFPLGPSLGAGLTIPAGRLPGGVWWSSNNVGVVGGIPNITTIYTNLYPSVNQGFNFSNIMYALAICPSNQVVYLNEGTYNLTNGLQFGTGWNFWFSRFGNNGVVLRGAGMGKTILNFGYDASLSITGHGADGGLFNSTNHAHGWLSGYSQGSTNITIDSTATGLTNGDLIMLTQENDASLVDYVGLNGVLAHPPEPQIVFTDSFGRQCNQLQFVRVTGVSNGTNLTIWPGVYMTNYQGSLHPQFLWPGTHDPAMMCGIEDMTINSQAVNVGGMSTVDFSYTYNCWLKNVENAYPWFAMINIDWSAHDSIVGCYVHDSATGGASLSYGFTPQSCSDVLVENNIIHRVTSPVLVQSGSSGCVFAYNYCTNMLYAASPGWLSLSLQIHGAHPTMNLFEGNKGTGVVFDDVHGSSSHNTVFRNWLYGYETNLEHYTNGYIINNTLCVAVMSSNRYESVIGNVLGTVNINTNYEDSVTNYPTFYGQNMWKIYWLGYWGNEGTLSPPTTNSDATTVTTLWRDGNYDTATLSTVWDGNGAVTLPASLYLTSKPSWWNNSSWPAIGSDLTPMVSSIPAELRFQALIGKPPPSPPSRLRVVGSIP